MQIKIDKIKRLIEDTNYEISKLKKMIEAIKNDITDNFEDSNYRIVLDSIQLRKCTKKLRKYEQKVQNLKIQLARLEGEKEI